MPDVDTEVRRAQDTSQTLNETFSHLKELNAKKGIAASNSVDIHIAVLKDEIVVLESRLEPHDTGHFHTAIGVLRGRIDELGRA